MSKRIIHTDQAPAPIGPYQQAVVFNDTLYASGQIAINPETSELVTHDISAETHQVMQNIGAVLKANQMDYNDILKTSIFIADMDQFSIINQAYGEYFTEGLEPARETVQVARLPKDVNVEISFIARK
jgi:2-iminobutanoate/2-iminopropanoate deaminase